MKNKRNKRSLHFSIVSMLLFCFVFSAAAQDKKKTDEATEKDRYAYTREGNELYKKKQYAEAESLYVRGGKHEPDVFTSAFNLGDALYRQGKYDQARQQFDMLTQSPVSADSLALVHHNIGNCYLQQKQYQPAIDAYKKALRLNPADEESRYNLAYAQKMLKQQQQKQQQNQKQQSNDKKKDDEKNKNEQDEQQKKKDELEKKKKELEKEQQQKNQQKQDNKQKQRDPATPEPERQKLEKENQKIDQRLDEIEKELEKINQQLREMQGQPQPKPESEIKKDEARRILEALKNEEKKTREKLDKKSKNSSYPETDKDW